jgi:predicted Zn finger-like uncharacterized protein
MFTTCPNCALNLAVTAADLRVGQGYVRCGRCVSVFNALISLADEAEIGPELREVEDKASATQSRPAPTGLDDLEATAQTPDPAPPQPEVEPEPVEHGPEDLAEVTEESRDMATGTFETIVLEGDTILQTEEFVDEAEVDEQLKAMAEQMEDQETRFETREAQDAAAALEAATPRPAPPFVAEQPADYAPAEATLAELLPERRPRRPVPRFLLVSIALAVLLVLQGVHHWRHPIAARVPWVGTVYAGLGAPLAPQWQLAAYDVRQLGAAADPANAQRIEIRASVRNGAQRAQPAPVLRVILQDRFGNELARHERDPADYLRGTALGMLAADQRVDASFWVDDPQQKAVGFELDACLREPGGALRCAADAATTR